MNAPQTTVTAGDLRALIARRRIPLYLVAARAGMHPATLGRMLTERRPLREGVADRILQALAEWERP